MELCNWDSGIAAPPGFRPPPLLDRVRSSCRPMSMCSRRISDALRAFIAGASASSTSSGKFVLDVSYVGNRGKGLNSTTLLNQLPTSRLAFGSLLQRLLTIPRSSRRLQEAVPEVPEQSDACPGVASVPAVPGYLRAELGHRTELVRLAPDQG